MGKLDNQKTAGDLLLEASNVYKERNLLYGNNYHEFGSIMKAFFPNGINLISEADHNRFAVFVHILTKLTRYVKNWKSGHQDSIRDATVYSAMLEELDGKNLKANDGRSVE